MVIQDEGGWDCDGDDVADRQTQEEDGGGRTVMEEVVHNG